MASSPELQPLQNTFRDPPRKRQTTHTIASQSSSLNAISPLPPVPSNFHGFIFTVSPKIQVVSESFLNGTFRAECEGWKLYGD